MSKFCLVTALAAESSTLISHYQLRPISINGVKAWEGNQCHLIQTGLGKLSAAAAVGAVGQIWPAIEGIINVGVAGADRPLGDVVMAHTVVDTGSNKRWYPHLPPSRHIKGVGYVAVHTLEQPCERYKHEIVFDMEAAGIVSSASRFLALSFVHCVKVISDNKTAPATRFDKNSVAALMQQTIPVLDQLMESLSKQVPTSAPNIEPLLMTLLKEHHHSATEQHKLRKLLLQHHALYDATPTIESLNDLHSAKSIRIHLNNRLSAYKFLY